MANVPNVPGVPPLNSYSGNPVALAIADVAAVVNYGLSIFPQWGIYLNGVAVIQPANIVTQALSSIGTITSFLGLPIFPVTASFIDFEYKQDWPISDYPVENGGFQTYDKVQLPSDIRIKLAGGGTSAQIEQFLTTIDTMANDLQLYDIATPSQPYIGYNCTHYDFTRSARNGVSLITADVWFKEVRITSTALFTSTASPANASAQNIGIQQPQTPSDRVDSAFSSLGGAN